MSKEFWKRLILIVVIGVLFIFAWTFFSQIQEVKLEEKKIKLNGIEISVEVADNNQSRTKGLQGKEGLEDNHGMLFIFDNKDYHAIHMLKMKFGIDILWIDEDQVVYMEEFVAPDEGKKSYQPPIKVDKVLEVEAGWIEKNNIGIGSTVEV